MDTRKIKLFIRDKYCNLVGKTPLVNRYNDIVYSIDCHFEDMNYCDASYRLLADEIYELKEKRFVLHKKGVVFVLEMDPYMTFNAKLRKKISQGVDIMKRYGIKQRKKHEY